jgi:proteasome lid subunit RPN8/RPN11/molybdopterin converting factor small subunit
MHEETALPRRALPSPPSPSTRERPLVLILPDLERRRLEGLARAGYPLETCGVLVGSVSPGRAEVRRVEAARNRQTERARDRYALAPLDLLDAENRAGVEGLVVIGIWHSHPDHHARPSETDRAAAWEGWSYLIASVTAAGVPEVRSWRLHDQAFQEEEILLMTRVIVRIPTPLRSFTGGTGEVEVHATTVGEGLQQLGTLHEGILERVLDESGEVRPFVNLFVGSREVSCLDGLATELREGEVLSIIPAVAGGLG